MSHENGILISFEGSEGAGKSTQIARLRKKIEPDPGNPSLIKTVRGVGYIFAAVVTGA